MLGKMEMRTPPGARPRDGRHCDLCGCSQPAVRCDKCGCQIFCLSCDDMYHRHPKRRFHLRKAVDPAPTLSQARPVLPVKVANLNAMNPGDPSKMPLPPPRKKKTSLFGSFRRSSPSGDNSPPLPKKEYSWTDRLGGIKKFMSNRPLPPLPNPDDNDGQISSTANGQPNSRGDMTFIHKKIEDRPPQLPSRSPRPQETPVFAQDSRTPSNSAHMMGQMQNGATESDINQNRGFSENQKIWPSRLQNQNGHQVFNTMSHQNQSGFIPPGIPGYPPTMHQSSSATDLNNLQNVEHISGVGPMHAHYPPQYPMNPHMLPHYPYPMYPQFPNYPQYFGNSMANLSNPPTTDGDLSENSETPSRHSSKKHNFRKRAKRSQSVMMDRMAYAGQFYPFGPYPNYAPPWGPPMPMETPPSPASSIRSLNKIGRSRRRKKATSEEDEEEFSPLSSSPLSRPKSSSSDKPTDRTEINRQAPLAKMSSSSEDESDVDVNRRRNKVNTIQRRTSEPLQNVSSPAVNRKRPPKLKKRNSSKQSDSEPQDVPQFQNDRRSSKESNPEPGVQLQSPSPMAQSPKVPSPTVPPNMWECSHCTFINPIGNRICQVCCKTFTPNPETPVMSTNSRPASAAESRRKQSSELGVASPDKMHEQEEEATKKDKQDMAILNSALDEAEKEINRGLEELMKLKDDIDNVVPTDKNASPTKETKSELRENSKPVYKSTGRMRTSLLEKLAINKPQTSKQTTSTEIQTGQEYQTSDKIIEARRFSNSSTTSDAYNSPLAQSPELGSGFNDKQKRDSSCQTQQQDNLADYLERKKVAEEAFVGRGVNNFGFGYGDRMDMVTSPVPAMYDRYFGGGLGMMQRSHSRASLFTGRINDMGPMEYGGPGFGYGGAPMYRSLSRGSLTGDYPDTRLSDFHNLRKADYYLSMEELVERRRQESMRAQGLELVRMIREAEQQGFTADDIQVALTHCGNRTPMEWLQDNWRNMLDSVVTLSTNYGNDKTENDIGVLSECEARDALRLHKGNIWAAVTECVEGRQKKYLELSGRGKFSRKDIVDALTSSEGDVEMAYAKLSKSTGKPFLMRIWGSGEGIQNQDGAQPVPEDMRDAAYDEDIIPHRYQKDEFGSDVLSDDLWSEGGADWEEEEFEEERGDIEDLQTCREDLSIDPQEMMTPESDPSDYMDAFALDDRNMSSPSDDVFYVVPETKPEKKKGTGFLSKLAALRKDSKDSVEDATNTEKNDKEFTESNNIDTADGTTKTEQTKGNGTLSTLKNTFSAIKDTVTGASKSDRKLPCTQPERRTIIVKDQLAYESLSDKSKSNVIITSFKPIKDDLSIKNLSNIDKDQKCIEDASIMKISDSGLKITGNQTDTSLPTKSKLEEVTKQADVTEVKKSLSLAEKLKQAKQKYSSRTNLSLTQDQTEGLEPSTSRSNEVLTSKATVSVDERTKSVTDEINVKNKSEKIIKNEILNDQIKHKIKEDIIDNKSKSNADDIQSNKIKNATLSTSDSKKVTNIEQLASMTVNDSLKQALQPKTGNKEEKLGRKSPDNKTLDSSTSENVDVVFQKQNLQDELGHSNTNSATDKLKNEKNNLLSDVSPSTLNAEILIKNVAPDSASDLKITESENKDETHTSSEQIQKVPDSVNANILNKINDSLKLAVSRKVGNVSSEATLRNENGSIESIVLPGLVTGNNKNTEFCASINVSEATIPQATALEDTESQDTKETIEKLSSQLQLDHNGVVVDSIRENHSYNEMKSHDTGKTSSLQLVENKPEIQHAQPSNMTENHTTQSMNKIASATTVSEDRTLNLHESHKIDSPSNSTKTQKEVSTENIDSQKVLDTDKNKEKKSDDLIANNFNVTFKNTGSTINETIENIEEHNTQIKTLKKETDSNTPLQNQASTNNIVSSDTTSNQTDLISVNKADSTSSSVTETTKPEKQKLTKAGKIKKIKTVEKSESKNQTNASKKAESKTQNLVDTVSDFNRKYNDESVSTTNPTVSSNQNLLPKSNENELKTENLNENNTDNNKIISLDLPNNIEEILEIHAKQEEETKVVNEIQPSSTVKTEPLISDVPYENNSTTEIPSATSSTNVNIPTAEKNSILTQPETASNEGENMSSATNEIPQNTPIPQEIHRNSMKPTQNTQNITDIPSTSSMLSTISSNSTNVEPIDITTSSSMDVKVEVTNERIPSTNEYTSSATDTTQTNRINTDLLPTTTSPSISTNTTKVETVKISESEQPKTEAADKSTDPSSEANEQHSKTLSTRIDVPAATSSKISLNTSEQNIVSNQDNSQNEDGDDSDTQYSDDSRPSSVTPPSPVDALRNRFEGFAGGLRGPVRPQSPFRRMSFNSRKQVIALERIRDTTADKPWFHQKQVEPVKVVVPKRTIRQQLEMERKVRKMVSDRKCRTYRKAEIVVQLIDMNFEEEEALQAANECSTLEQAISYLQQECLLCAGHFAVSQIVSMTHCEHRACRECIRAYFTVQIRDRTILDLLCPFCNQPDIVSDEDVAQDYFNHLDIMLKKLVDVEIHELFQRKLRDRVLMKDPNFRWCSQCSSGFISEPNLKRLICPDCNAVTCASCRRLWERDHQGISCEAFAALKDSSDPEAQAAGLAKLLTEDGIDCPRCHFRYALAKGGCMHFRCIQCQHDFCSGCSKPFKMGQKCGVSEFCIKLGLHAHHPRNCLFYLRDKEPEDLQKLLDMNNVKYNKEPPDGMEVKSMCQVMEQKETADGMLDDICGKDVQDGFAGLCRVHYVEYLGQLVNKNQVDPIQIFDNDDLELVLRRASIRLPARKYRENDDQYKERLIKLIQDVLPLDKMDGS